MPPIKVEGAVGFMPKMSKEQLRGHRKPKSDAEDLAHCNRLLAHALTQPRIQKLFNALTKNSCPLTPSRHIRCVRCTPQVAGGFGPAIGIALCADRRIPPRRFNDALAHELIHAYDYCTRNIDFEDPKQHACAEIRAASLSGDCEWDREWARKRYLAIPFRKGAFESCVRRRAALAVMYNREVGDVGKAFQVVKEMYDICVQDVQPFTKDDLIQLD
ncbi:peptidase M76 family-domain-containing protein [Fimicolochytrium jonesii]|uniref:peptidase M76 family-domain-containing protein n=1 Tax=Fimicolochytrium jonesii TaxID=1396493 RepID=UPI0022FF18EA|nr:peptidase M76 family-domain-containing protein [Fimicolochytrium jonesii]KAI8816720.1 peptidase M76 family-domain-containing protein [Fimicolochytrium jonesii]